MSGHNKWSTIKHKKGAADAKKGKVFSKIAKEITIAAREGGGNVEMNPRLRAALLSGKAVNMPSDNVKRAIQKGTGELAGQAAMEEIVYEGYAPGGVAIIVNVLTDNRNRAASDIRLFFAKGNGSLAASGSVLWMFKRKAKFTVMGEKANQDKIMELLLEAGADVEDVSGMDGVGVEIIAPPAAFGEVFKALEGAGIPASESTIIMIPENTVEVKELQTAKQIMRIVDALEDYDDVQQVISNYEIADEIAEQLD
jgi:YebC/PmpR family DNA-binding regulatory protein